MEKGKNEDVYAYEYVYDKDKIGYGYDGGYEGGKRGEMECAFFTYLSTC